MEKLLNERLDSIRKSFEYFQPELILVSSLLIIILLGFFAKKKPVLLHAFSLLVFLSAMVIILWRWEVYITPQRLFVDMLRSDTFSAYFKLLFNVSAILTVLMTWRNGEGQKHLSEYYALLITIMIGAHLLVSSVNFIMIFLSIELISIPSYILTGFSFDKKASEGGLKYFLFGSVASAAMLYGLSILYGLSGTLDFSSDQFIQKLMENQTALLLVGGLMTLSGFLYKIAAAPLHPWAPDVYEAAPMPVVAFFSVVPKLAGVAILSKFILALHLFGQSFYDWQFILSAIIILTITIGNFSALAQKTPKRLMAYSSIAQSGFLLVGVVTFLPQGIQFMMFYAMVYLLMNFIVFIYLQYFEKQGITTIALYSGLGKYFFWPALFMLIAFVSLTGLPPTSGFTAKLFIFSSLWEAYASSEKVILLVLLIFGLLNTVVSLFYYLRIPYYSFVKPAEPVQLQNNLLLENLLGLILVLVVLVLFFGPGLLMGWINKINFVL